MDVDTRWFDDERVRWECARAWCRPARRQLRALLEFIISSRSSARGPSLGIFETEPSLNLREQNRHASLSHSSPRTMTRHRGSESCLALVYTLLLATLVVSSSAALTREATTRTASRSKDPTTTEQHSVATRTPPVLAAAQPRVDDLNASIREIHINTTNATDAHGNVEQSRWWWWWTWWAAPRVVYIYPGHQQQYPHNPDPYPPVQPPLVEPNCPQVSLF